MVVAAAWRLAMFAGLAINRQPLDVLSIKHCTASTCRVLNDMNCVPSSTLRTRDISEVQDDFELPPLDNRLVASAAAVLDAAQIPFVLCGNYMLTVFGIPTVVNVRTSRQSELTSSNAYERASTLLLKMIASQKVAMATKYFLILRPPHIHLHITESERLGLYKKSDILWRLPNLLNVDSENIILASDPNQLPGPDILGRGG